MKSERMELQLNRMKFPQNEVKAEQDKVEQNEGLNVKLAFYKKTTNDMQHYTVKLLT